MTFQKEPQDAGKTNLVLWCGLDESIVIDGRKITLTVVQAKGSGARIAFLADAAVKIDREAVYLSKVADGSYLN